jgi:hypothetical protein
MTVQEGAVEYLNDLIWHDSVLQKIQFVRTNSVDQVIFDINLLTSWENQISILSKLIFKNCLSVRSNMNWGVKCMSEGEMISEVECNKSNSYISDTLTSYNQFLKDKYAYFKMTLASTGSLLELTFDEVELIQLDSEKNHNAPPPIFPVP